MRITQIDRIEGLGAFRDAGPLELGKINVFVGPNNAGKSTLARIPLALQEGLDARLSSVGLGEERARVRLRIEAWAPPLDQGHSNFVHTVGHTGVAELSLGRGNMRPSLISVDASDLSPVRALEPAPQSVGAVIPFLSGRRPQHFDAMGAGTGPGPLASDLRNLAERIAPLTQSDHPGHEAFTQACRQALGFGLAVYVSEGQLPGRLGSGPDGRPMFIPIDELGAGVAHLAGMFAALCQLSDGIVVLEEPETELHPAALRALLRLIVDASTTNQFFITTHSAQVVMHLGADSACRLFRVQTDPTQFPPASTVEPVAAQGKDRRALLGELGYLDHELPAHDGWLLLEEATAERVVRSVLIPHHVPPLAGVKTVSAQGADKAPALAERFRTMALYAHLEDHYKGRVWCLLDGDEPGTKARDRLVTSFSGEEYDGHFVCLDAADFEDYLPEPFVSRWRARRRDIDRQELRRFKQQLWAEVWGWIEADPSLAARKFGESAAPVIEVLRDFAEQLRVSVQKGQSA